MTTPAKQVQVSPNFHSQFESGDDLIIDSARDKVDISCTHKHTATSQFDLSPIRVGDCTLDDIMSLRQNSVHVEQDEEPDLHFTIDILSKAKSKKKKAKKEDASSVSSITTRATSKK